MSDKQREYVSKGEHYVYDKDLPSHKLYDPTFECSKHGKFKLNGPDNFSLSIRFTEPTDADGHWCMKCLAEKLPELSTRLKEVDE